MANSFTNFFASVFSGKKLAGYLIPAIVGGLIVFAFMLGMKACTGASDKPLYDSVQAYRIADSLLKLQSDSLAKIQPQTDTVQFPIFLDKYHKIVVIDSTTLKAKAQACDSALNLCQRSDQSLKALLKSKDAQIALLNRRIANCQKEQKAIADSAHNLRKPPVHFEIPSVIKYGLDLRLGAGPGALGALQLEGDLRFSRIGLFLQAGALYQDKPRFYLIGGASFRIGGN